MCSSYGELQEASENGTETCDSTHTAGWYDLIPPVTMTIGEIETDPLFFSTPNLIEYPVVTYLLWIVFLIVMPVLLQNMLVR